MDEKKEGEKKGEMWPEGEVRRIWRECKSTERAVRTIRREVRRAISVARCMCSGGNGERGQAMFDVV